VAWKEAEVVRLKAAHEASDADRMLELLAQPELGLQKLQVLEFRE
jgi:hypothetical protein